MIIQYFQYMMTLTRFFLEYLTQDDKENSLTVCQLAISCPQQQLPSQHPLTLNKVIITIESPNKRMKVYPTSFTNPKHLLNLSIPSNSDSLTYSNIDTPESKYNNTNYNALPNTHLILQFSHSKQRGKNKRILTEPEEEKLKGNESQNVGKSMKQGKIQKKVVLEFDRTKFKRIKNKIEEFSIRRENSKEFLLEFAGKKQGVNGLKGDGEKGVGVNKERRNRNMTYCVEQRPKTIVHRPQASTGPLLSFTERPKRSVSKSIQKSLKQKEIEPLPKKVESIFNPPSNTKVERKISYLKTEPEHHSNGIQAEFEEFLRNEQNSLASSRKKREKIITIPFLQFGKSTKPFKAPEVQTESRKYQYSSFYDRQVNVRNNQLKANTTRDGCNQEKQPLASCRSTREFQESTPSSLNNSRKILKY